MCRLILASIIVWGLLVYAALGVAFAGWFLARGAARLDPAAASAGVWFRLIIAPGVVALWPVLARRVLASADTAGSAAPESHL